MANPDTWYFSSDGENQLGPFPWTQIQEYLNDGRLSPETFSGPLICRIGYRPSG